MIVVSVNVAPSKRKRRVLDYRPVMGPNVDLNKVTPKRGLVLAPVPKGLDPDHRVPNLCLSHRALDELVAGGPPVLLPGWSERRVGLDELVITIEQSGSILRMNYLAVKYDDLSGNLKAEVARDEEHR